MRDEIFNVPLETPEEREKRKAHECENEKWRVRLEEFVAKYSGLLWGAVRGDGTTPVHAIGVRASDTERCIVLYLEKRTDTFNKKLGELRKIAEQEPDAHRFAITIKGVEEPRPQKWQRKL